MTSTIHSAVVPSGNVQIFKALATLILSSNNPIAAPAKDNAMSAYLLMESMFSQLLTHQYQGASMVVNAENYNDNAAGSPIGRNANNYMTGTFENFLRDECDEFISQVNWLVINIHDYRDKDSYATDMRYQNQGLAPDPVAADILARARFFCAQVLQPYNDNRARGTNGTWAPNTQIATNVVGNGFGLKGVITVPGDYTKGQSITLNFYDTNNNLVASKSVTPNSHKGRYPYTMWVPHTYYGYNVGPMAAKAGYDWTTYEFDLSGSTIPAGTYFVRFVEQGKDPNGNAGPWVHTETLLGTVNLQYYDPQAPAASTSAATNGRSQLFGFFSLYWPWNFQRFVSSPVSRMTDSTESYYWDAMSSNTPDLTFSPNYPNYTGLVNKFSFNHDKNKRKSDAITYSIPFTTEAPTVNVNIVYQGILNRVHGYFPNASYMKSMSVGYSYDITNDVYGDVNIDSGKSAATTDGNPSVWDTHLALKPLTMHNDNLSSFEVSASFTSVYKSGWIVDKIASYDGELNWYMQLLFTDTQRVKDIQ
jgi:hypothetical protein